VTLPLVTVQEARNPAVHGGPKYNKIESPGKKMLDEDGE
jgi:hypothetical protein